MAKAPSKPPQKAPDPRLAEASAARAAFLASKAQAESAVVDAVVERDKSQIYDDVLTVEETVRSAEIIPVNFMSPWRGSSIVTRILLPAPRIGGKAWMLNRKGIFVLEEGPGVLRTIACTHIGSGSMIVCNGVPNERGEFPARPTFTLGSEEEYNGRALFRANPVVMGSWMMDAGFSYGLTVQAEGGMDNNCAIATIVWLPAPAPRALT